MLKTASSKSMSHGLENNQPTTTTTKAHKPKQTKKDTKRK